MPDGDAPVDRDAVGVSVGEHGIHKSQAPLIPPYRAQRQHGTTRGDAVGVTEGGAPSESDADGVGVGVGVALQLTNHVVAQFTPVRSQHASRGLQPKEHSF